MAWLCWGANAVHVLVDECDVVVVQQEADGLACGLCELMCDGGSGEEQGRQGRPSIVVVHDDKIIFLIELMKKKS